MRRIAEVMGIPAFRRLWTSAYLCCVGDWLSLLGLSSLLATLTGSSEFALSGVVATQLLPGLLLAPLAGHLADRFDRRKVMIATDLARCALFLSIAVVGTTWWLLTGLSYSSGRRYGGRRSRDWPLWRRVAYCS